MKVFQSKAAIFAEACIKDEPISDGDFHSVSDDIYELAGKYSGPKNGDLAKTYFCEGSYVDRLPPQMPSDFGSYVYPEQ